MLLYKRGDDFTVFIAAELGVNWRNMVEARRMIGLAKDAGADAVKFQVYKPEHVKGHPRQHELEDIILNPEKIKYLKQIADGCGIEFFATPYFLEAVDWLEEASVKRYKIRYTDRHNPELLERIKSTGKPYIVSCDDPLKDIYEIDQNGILAFCIPLYPPPIMIVPKGFELYHGYSSHYPSIVPPLVAASRGCAYLEVHLKVDKYSGGYKPIDDAASITFSQLAELCRLVREIEKVEW